MRYFFFVFIFSLVLCSALQSQSLDELFRETDEYFKAHSYDGAAKFADKALVKAANDYGENSVKFAIALDKRARIHWGEGEYEKALVMYRQSLGIINNNSGEKSKEYATVLLDLAILYQFMDRFGDAVSAYKKTISLMKTVHGGKHPDYIKALDRFAGIYFQDEQLGKAQVIYEEAYKVVMELPDEETGPYMNCLCDLANIYEETYQYEKATTLVKDILQISGRMADKDDTGFQNSVNRNSKQQLARLYYKTGQYNETEPLLFAEIASVMTEMKESIYSEPESFSIFTQEYLLQNSDIYYTYGLSEISGDKSFLLSLMNLQIATRGVILTSAIGMKRRICSSDDISVLSNYDSLTAYRTLITDAYSMTPAERKSKGINIKELEARVDQYESNLVYLSEYYKNEVESRDIGYEDLQMSLKPDEAVIEYVNFNPVGKDYATMLDTLEENVYAAFIVRAGSGPPEFLKLCASRDIEKLISSGTEENIYVKDIAESRKLYDLIFQPAEKYLNGINQVFISPSGLLCRVSFAALAPDDRSLLIDKYKIKYSGSLREIVTDRKSGKGEGTKLNDAYIFGGIKYEVDSAVMVTNAMRSRGEYDENMGDGSEMEEVLSERRERGGWGYLKGTMEEAEKISGIFGKNGYQSKIFSGDEGTEEAFKSMSGNRSPSIIHISTHGFFFPDPNPEKPWLNDANEMKTTTARGMYKSSANPFFRSGLILSGANNVWKYNRRIKGIEDGVLTAYEVSNMDLVNTKLAVLSACETGLGDVHSGEGVFGLQRSFKIAGAKNVIMSLWKVPDRETAELMEIFYMNLIEKKMNIDEAFYSAQMQMRQKYTDPYFWAAFILM